MKKEDISRANYLVEKIDETEKLLRYINQDEESLKILPLHSCPFIVKFDNDLEYRFSDNVNYRMFHNILKSSIELDLEKYLDELDKI
jgi:hypothetical protein